jgi:hypothetical protein
MVACAVACSTAVPKRTAATAAQRMQAHTDSRHSLSILPSHSLAGYVADTAIIPFKYQALACDNPHLSTCTPTLKIAIFISDR